MALASDKRQGGQELLRKAQLYLTDYLISSSFQHFVSLFEDFLFELLRIWLIANPESLSKKQVEFGTVLDAPDKASIVASVVDRQLNELRYKRLADRFDYLHVRTSIDRPIVGEIEILTEIKASRDILVHNNGTVNATYIAKAGTRARHQDGERLEIPELYHRQSWETVKEVVEAVSAALISKAVPGDV